MYEDFKVGDRVMDKRDNRHYQIQSTGHAPTGDLVYNLVHIRVAKWQIQVTQEQLNTGFNPI